MLPNRSIPIDSIVENIYKEIIDGKWWNMKSFFSELKKALFSHENKASSLLENIIGDQRDEESGNSTFQY